MSMESVVLEIFNNPIFTAGITIGMTYMALKGRLDRLDDKLVTIKDQMQMDRQMLMRVERKVDDHIKDIHAA